MSPSCPQIPSLDFGDEVIEYFPRHPFPVEPSSPSSTRSSGRSAPSLAPSEHSSSSTGPRHGTHTRTASLNSTTSRTLSPLEVALSTRTSMLLSRGNPRVIKKATMEGLVQYLLQNPDDTEQHDTFFIGHTAFIPSQDVLKILIRQFHEATMYTDDMRDINVMCLIKNWLMNKNVIIANDVLSEMQLFADTVSSSGRLRDQALEVLQCIPEKASLNFPLPSITSSFESRSNTRPTAGQLAVALATLGKERYLSILAGEYIAYACDLTTYSPNLHEAVTLNKRITNWVMSCILRCDDYKDRAELKTFFVDTARECGTIRDFSSMCAIVDALKSDIISRLDLTHKAMRNGKQQYEKLATLFRQESNYRAYRAAVQRDDRRGCIPCHDVLLHDIRIVLRNEGDVEEHHETPLINFEKWAHLKEKALDALRYRDIPLRYDTNGLETAKAYLQQQLQLVATGDDFNQLLQMESNRLAQIEKTMRRVAASRSVGFD